LRVLPIGISLSDYHDILVDGDGDGAEALRDAMIACIADHGVDWSAWEMPELPPQSQALRLRVPPGWVELLERASACPVLALPADAGAFVQSLPSRKRRGVRMARNRAARRGGIACVAAEDAGAASVMLERLFRLHGTRWAERGAAGVLADEPIRAFHREVAARMFRAGLLRMFELRIAGTAAAVYYGFHHGDCAYAYLAGFDPAYAFESPGVILLAHAIECAIREGAREFHFLRGREPYKYGWGAEDRWNSKRVFQRAEPYARAS
jgi:CelD/BcsL family acetyltransferase involved in cellulose biosynthesis